MVQKPARTIFSKIGLKLIIPYLVISFLTLLLIGGILYYSYQVQLDSIQKIQEEISLKTSNEVNFYISNIIENLKLLSKNVSCLDCKETNSLQLKSLTEINPSINEVSIIDRHGQEQSRLRRYEPKASADLGNVADQEKFKKVIEEDFYISSVYISTYNLPFISISLPIVDKTNTKIGVVAAEIDLSPLWDTISRIKVKKTGYAYVVDQNGSLIAYKDVTLVKENPSLKDIQGVKNFLDHTYILATYDSFNKEKVIGNWKPIEVTGWGLLVELPIKEVFQETLVLLGISGVSIFLFLSFIGIILLIIYKQLLVPLGYLQQGVSKVQSGNLDYKINISSKDEIGNLADTFNQMTSQLQQSYRVLEQKVKERTKELAEKLTELSRLNVNLEENKTAMFNLLEDARELEEELKREKESVEQKVEERTRELRVAKDKISENWMQLQQEKARLVASINSLHLGFMIVDAKPKIIMMNSAIKKILEPVEGKWTFEAIVKRLKGSVDLKVHYEKCIKEKKAVEIKDIEFGGKFIQIFLAPILMLKDSRRVIGGAILVEDITEAKILERSREEFFAIASHELRTPLTAIRGNTALIQDYFLAKLQDEQLKELVSDIHESSVRLIHIVNDFLDVSRLEQKKVEFKKEKFSLAKLIQETVDEFKASASQKGLYLRLGEPPADLAEVIADKKWIRQVIANLFDNAIKFTQKGGITAGLEKENGFVKVKVIDTGSGISKQNQNLLFRKFQQAGERILARDVTKGTGMGLYIAKLLVEGMGGKIYLESSEVGKGSTFVFTLSQAKPGSKDSIDKKG